MLMKGIVIMNLVRIDMFNRIIRDINSRYTLIKEEMELAKKIFGEIFNLYDITGFTFDSQRNVKYNTFEEALMDLSIFSGRADLYILSISEYQIINLDDNPASGIYQFTSHKSKV
jgi:hypothetical protein